MDANYMPPPLSPRRLISTRSVESYDSGLHVPEQTLLPPAQIAAGQHSRANSGGSVSWLDTIDESVGSSPASSVHSVASDGMHRRRIRAASGATEAEFDAALDAAVEAAYGDELEPFDYSDKEIVSALASVQMAKEQARQVEREEAILAAHRRNQQLQSNGVPVNGDRAAHDFDDAAAEHEEELLDDMTKEFMVDDFDFGLRSNSTLPRQSDSSGYSHATWHSSVSSTRNTTGVNLSTVTETPDMPSNGLGNGLPVLNEEVRLSSEIATSPEKPSRPLSKIQGQGVRDRRLSGQNAKQLKIETSIPPTILAPKTHDIEMQTKVEAPLLALQTSQSAGPAETLPSSVFKPASSATSDKGASLIPLFPPLSMSPLSGVSPADSSAVTVSPATPALAQAQAADASHGFPPASPGSRPAIKKNKSSMSLKNRALSVSTSPDASDASPITPHSTTFTTHSNGSRKALANQSGPSVPTPTLPTFNVDNIPSGGLSLFESDIHSPYSPGSPNQLALNAPIPLEPCPDSFLLRPFWLMRCFYQTIAHPRGGYLSTKLFVPRDVWRVKGVKIKNVDDKVSNCDLLTAALQKLASVDTYDADAVHEEMQSFEVVLDQVQTSLSKKLGSEVGIHGVSSLFKDAPPPGSEASSHSEAGSTSSRSASQSKSYLASWRKLRSKSSAVNLAGAGARDHGKDPYVLTMSTLPMTSLPNPRFAKRDPSQLDLSGPHALYMGALARLFDAVQVIDQIARQVEDPGLRHSSSTHVGLELCARHASEFFGFYVCRFVLSDLGMLLDKFIKRGSEWVLI